MNEYDETRRSITFGGVPGDGGVNGPLWGDALPLLQAAQNLGRAHVDLMCRLENAGMKDSALYSALVKCGELLKPELSALRPTFYVQVRACAADR